MICKHPFRACRAVPVQGERQEYVARALTKDMGRILLKTTHPQFSSGNKFDCKN